LFRSEDSLVPPLQNVPNKTWLRAILNAKIDSQGDATFLNVEERAQGLWHESRGAALQIASAFVRSNRTPLQDRFICGLAQLCGDDDMRALGRDDLQVVEAFVRCRPELAIPLSHSAEALQRAALHGLLAARQGASMRDMILHIVTSSDCDAVVTDALNQGGGRLVSDGLSFLLTAYRDNASFSVGRGWLRALRKSTDAVLDWFDAARQAAGAPSFVVLIKMVDPHSPSLERVGYEVWREFLECSGSTVKPSDQIEVLAFMLVRAYSSHKRDAAEFAVRCFGPVHDAASRAELTESTWRMLSADLPSLGHHRDWDVCERLRRSLIQNFVAHKWSERFFFLASRHSEAFGPLLNSCSHVPGGRNFLHSLESVAAAGDSPASPGQLEAIRKRRSWRSRLL
jgi:hypothetical protein